MLPLIVGPIISMLTSKGLHAIGSAVEGGADKALEFVSDKTGIDLTSKTTLSNEDVAKLEKFEADNKIELEELALANKKEDNRHEERTVELEQGNTESAREMNIRIQESENATDLAKNSAYYIDFAIITGTVLMGILLFFVQVPKDNLQIANILFGAFLGFVGTIVNYNRGSSSSSKDKDAHIKTLTTPGK